MVEEIPSGSNTGNKSLKNSSRRGGLTDHTFGDNHNQMLPDIDKAALIAISRPSGVEKDPLTNRNVG
tara:strand:+ start:238 stop:438 length:201 start_codon:yes stop_codon:yes gene_type:complete